MSQSNLKSGKNLPSGSRLNNPKMMSGKLGKFGSRYMSRLGGKSKWRSSRNRGTRRANDGSSQYSHVRENGDPIIWRDGKDVTPLPISKNDISKSKYNSLDLNHISNSVNYNNHPQSFDVFIKPSEPILSLTSQDDDTISVSSTQAPLHSSNLNSLGSTSMGVVGNLGIDASFSMNPNTVLVYDSKENLDILNYTNPVEFKKTIQNNPSILDENITIQLSETRTKFLFEMQSTLTDTVVEESTNEDHELNEDLYSANWCQTHNPPMKDRSILAKPKETQECATQASKWLLYDAYHKDMSESDKPTGDMSQQNPNILKEVNESKTFKSNLEYMERAVIQNIMAEQQILYRVHAEENEFIDDDFESEEISQNNSEVKDADVDAKISQALLQENNEKASNLLAASDMNALQGINEIPEGEEGDTSAAPTTRRDSKSSKATKEEEIPQVPMDAEEEEIINNLNTPQLHKLWSYQCPQTANMPCHVLEFNPQNTDLLAAGYGSWEFGLEDRGKIMFWTLKNPVKPERIYHLNSSVCSLNFSKLHPYLLAVGLFDGNVCVYDIRSELQSPILESELGQNTKHSSAVWNVLWEKPNEMQLESQRQLHREKLYSIASDGLIKQWNMKKGFSCTNIMSLKRVPNLSAFRGSMIDNTIRSRQGSGMCFDFPSYSHLSGGLNSNNSQYYVGTEDGIIHKCSVSYNEQVLQTYYGHTAPVYRIECSPFNSNIFMTCSKDWTIKIWNGDDSKNNKAIYNLSCNHYSINDVCWSPFDSCVFASVSNNSQIQIWNLAVNKKDPFILHSLSHDDTTSPAINNEETNATDAKNDDTAVPPPAADQGSNEENGVMPHTVIFAPDAPALLTGLSDGRIDVFRLNCLNTSPTQNIFAQNQKLAEALQTEDS